MNPKKCQVIILGVKTIPESFSVETENILRKPVTEVTLLGVTLNNKLNFNSHISNICKEASKKLSALLRAGNWLNHSSKKKKNKKFIFLLSVQLFSSSLDVLQQRGK